MHISSITIEMVFLVHKNIFHCLKIPYNIWWSLLRSFLRDSNEKVINMIEKKNIQMNLSCHLFWCTKQHTHYNRRTKIGLLYSKSPYKQHNKEPTLNIFKKKRKRAYEHKLNWNETFFIDTKISIKNKS